MALRNCRVARRKLVATLTATHRDQDFVREISAATDRTKGMPDAIFIFKLQIVTLQQSGEGTGDFISRPIVKA